MENTFWTMTKIQEANRAAGSHWFDRSTMRFFRCRLLDTVFQGDGGIFFVTSERSPVGPRRYTVRKFDPTTADVDTVGKFNDLKRNVALSIAKECAGGKIRETHDENGTRWESLEDEFIRKLRAHADPNTPYDDVRRLMRLAKAHHRHCENACNREVTKQERDSQSRRERTMAQIAEARGMKIYTQGDPRGVTVRLVMPDGYTDDWGKEGVCIPHPGDN